jgi:hypothetical protein
MAAKLASLVAVKLLMAHAVWRSEALPRRGPHTVHASAIELRGKPESWYGGATRRPESSGTAGAAPVVVYSHHDGASVDHALIG